MGASESSSERSTNLEPSFLPFDDNAVAELLPHGVVEDVTGMAGRYTLEDDGSDDGKSVYNKQNFLIKLRAGGLLREYDLRQNIRNF